MKHRLIAVTLLFAATCRATAEWQVVSVRSEPSAAAGAEHRHLELEESETGDSAAIELALFSTKSCRLRVIDNRGDDSLGSQMRAGGFIAGVNGGYFDPDFSPLGLRVIDGKTVMKLGRGRLMSGVIVSNGSVQILRSAEFSRAKKINAAIQCGPMIVDSGRRVPGLESTRAARRTFAAIETGDRAGLGFCSDATLADLSKMLTVKLGDFKIQRALNLDGGSSSAIWFKRKDGSILSISEEKTVRDFIGVIPR